MKEKLESEIARLKLWIRYQAHGIDMIPHYEEMIRVRKIQLQNI